MMNSPRNYPLPKALAVAFPDQPVDAKSLVGNGAYRLEEWLPNRVVTLERSPTYWDRANVRLARVRFLTLASAETQIKNLRLGAIDMTDEMEMWDFRFGKPPERAHQVSAAKNVTDMLTFGPDGNGAMQDSRLRRALSLAIDRELIANRITGGAYLALDRIVPADLIDASRRDPPNWPADQPAREELARKIWASSGLQKPTGLSLIYIESPERARIVRAILQMWQEKLNFTVRAEGLPADAYFRQLRSGAFAIAFQTFNFISAETLLDRFESRSMLANSTGFASPDYDQLIQKAESEPDRQKRAGLLLDGEQQLLRDALLVPVVQAISRRWLSDRVIGVQSSRFSVSPSRDLDLRE
jgi:oligopeptide transport system substrate-binding protein